MASLVIVVVFFFSMSMILLLFAAPGQGTKNCFIDSIYSFGDSIADTGNLLQQGPVGLFAPIGRYPYGKTMNKSTGRCSDGLLMIDYFGMYLFMLVVYVLN